MRMQDDQPGEILYLQLAESIATPIRAGTLARGERIPSVRELARSRGVSMGTVQQAYRMLEDAQLIEARPRSGYFVAARPLALPSEPLAFIQLPIHKAYGFGLPILPVVAEAEACAEKLARYRRVALARDLYDLNHFASRTIDEPLVRRLWVLKVWGDVVDDRRGTRPLRTEDVLDPRSERDFQPDSIGVLTRPVDVAAWEARVRTRFAFLTDLDTDEQRWAACDERHRREVENALAALQS